MLFKASSYLCGLFLMINTAMQVMQLYNKKPRVINCGRERCSVETSTKGNKTAHEMALSILLSLPLSLSDQRTSFLCSSLLHGKGDNE